MWAASSINIKSRIIYHLRRSWNDGIWTGCMYRAKVGKPDKTVINIAGDGCFRMNMNEIATAARYHIPIIQVVVNNHVLGMVRQWQTLFYHKRYSNTILNDAVDFVKLKRWGQSESVSQKRRSSACYSKGNRIKKNQLSLIVILTVTIRYFLA